MILARLGKSKRIYGSMVQAFVAATLHSDVPLKLTFPAPLWPSRAVI